MALTPEGIVKKAVKLLLAKYGDELYATWPVPYGYGDSTLDCLIAYRGRFISVETKAEGKMPTPRQRQIMSRMLNAGADIFILDSKEDVKALEEYLDDLREREAWRGGSTTAP